MNGDLPQDWQSITLGELFEFKYGKGLPHEKRNTCGAVNVYGSNGIIGIHNASLTKGPTIIIGRKGSVGEIHFSPQPCWPIDTTYFIDEFPGDLPPRYWELFLKSIRLGQQEKSSAIPGISRDDIYALEVPVPPLAEQRRIVDALDALLRKVETSRQRVDKISLILKRFRQSIRAAACSGRLTEDWRKQHPTLLDLAETVNMVWKGREKEANTSAQKDKIKVIYETVEENDSSELPESWRYIALNKLCWSFDYGTSAKSQPSGKVPVLRMGNIKNGHLDWADLVYTSNPTEIKTYSLKPNTVLFNRTNSPELVGKTAIYRGEQAAIFAGYLIRINPVPALDPEYLNLCLNTTYAKEFCLRMKTDGVSQSNINAQKLGTFEVPFCPLTEQQEIVRRVRALFEIADRIATHSNAAKEQVDKLTQSLLAKAFRGDLVPQDPNDEPVEKLLERLRTRPTRALG